MLNTVFSRRCEDVANDRNRKEQLTWTIGDGGFHARGMYPTQDLSRMGTVKMKQEEEADTRTKVEGEHKI